MHEFFFLQAEDGIGDVAVTGVQTCALPISVPSVYMQVRPASICGTDLHIYGWDRWSQGRIKPPLTLGHGFCGNVERVGAEVKIGRASCREGVKISGVPGSLKKKKMRVGADA